MDSALPKVVFGFVSLTPEPIVQYHYLLVEFQFVDPQDFLLAEFQFVNPQDFHLLNIIPANFFSYSHTLVKWCVQIY